MTLIATTGVAFSPVSSYNFFDSRPHLGVSTRDVTSQDVSALSLARERGVYVQTVGEESPAARAGIEPGDVITELSGIQVISVRHFQRLPGGTPQGRVVELALVRDGTALTLQARPSKPARPGMQFLPRFDRCPSLRALKAPARPRLGIRGDALTPQLAGYFGVEQGVGVLVGGVRCDPRPSGRVAGRRCHRVGRRSLH